MKIFTATLAAAVLLSACQGSEGNVVQGQPSSSSPENSSIAPTSSASPTEPSSADEASSTSKSSSAVEHSSSMAASSLAESISEPNGQPQSESLPAESDSPKDAATEQSALPEVAITPAGSVLGEVMTVTVKNAADLSVSATTDLPFKLQFFPAGQDQIALLPVSYNLSPGLYNLTITAGETVSRNQLTISGREFQVQHLTIDEGVAGSTNTAEGNAQWANLIEPLKPVSHPDQYWESLFLYPVPGHEKITTEFGLSRYTNGSQTAVRHSGIDIAAPSGTPIIAPNHGVVQFAGNLILTGNTIVIEHGLGLKSFYYHMESLSVSTGDTVSKGQQIGTVGSTGYSTGPHLHFAMAVNNVFVNPWSAFETPYIPVNNQP